MPKTLEPEILAGDGDSEQTAIIFARCFLADRVRAEYEFICSRFGAEHIGWKRGMHFTLMSPVSMWRIDLADGTSRSVYFDTSNTVYTDD